MPIGPADMLGVAVGVAIGVLLIVVWAITAGRRAAGPPRQHPELRYAARTAERAGIFWAVRRVLDALFGGRR